VRLVAQDVQEYHMGKWLLLAALMIPVGAQAVMRDFTVVWIPPTQDVNGDPLPYITGFNIFQVGAGLVASVGGDQTSAAFRMNVPFGEVCFNMTAVVNYNGIDYESDLSNTVCREVAPGRPFPPVMTSVE